MQSMNSEQNNSLQSNNKNDFLSNHNGTRRHSNKMIKTNGQENPSGVSCSPGLIKKNNSSDIRNTGFPENLQNPFSQITGNKNETSITETRSETECPLSREDIVARRKLKVAARKKAKKPENTQINKNATIEPGENSGFSLQLTSQDFPTLNNLKIKKKISSSNQGTLIADNERESFEKSSMSNEYRNGKNFEKSWKPKVKDPIHIDLSQALLNKNEKHKAVIKKPNPPIQRNVLSGNILDSDNPTRKKGKVRPDKVQKPSKLKSHILDERKKKLLENKECTTTVSECPPSETTQQLESKPCSLLDEKDNILHPLNCDLKHSSSVPSDKKPSEDKQNMICPVFPTNIHSRRFREYCTNCLTNEIVSSVCALLERIAYFQDRNYAREPIKASAKRRYVAGINQVSKYLKVRKVKLLVIAPDLEKNPGEGGLDEKVQFFKTEAESQGVPCVFGPNRKRLGKAVKKNTLVSCVAVLSHEGAEEHYAKVLEALHESKTKYLRLVGFEEDGSTKTVQDVNLKVEDNYTPANDVTASLLAALREDVSPANKLLSAIQPRGDPDEE